MRVLLVEDDAVTRRLVSDVLEERGHAVDAHAHGETAWAACKEIVFDLAVLDVVVPGVDGLTLSRRMRGRLGGEATAVLVVTGAVERADLSRVLEAGADDYLAKPFGIDELEVRLTILERVAAERARRIAAEAMQGRLLDATRRVTASLAFTETLRAVADEALRLTEAEVAMVAQPAPGGEQWELLTVRGPLAARWEDPPPGIVGQGAFATALRTVRTVNVPDYAANGAPPRGPRSEAIGIRSVLAVPLRAGEAAIGVFGAESRQPGHFTPTRQRLLEGLAEAAALAVAHAQEVEQRRKAETALRASEERYRLVTEAVPLGIWEWDMRTGIVAWSGAGRGVLGYEWGETTASADWWHGIVHPDDRESVQVRAAAAIETGAERLTNELRVRRADGSYAQVSVLLLRLFRDVAGAPIRTLGVIQDVTSVRAAEAEHDRLTQALARAEERERVAMNLHDVGVQTLFGLSMRLAAARRHVAAKHDHAGEVLEAAGAAVGEAMHRLRGHVRALTLPPATAGDAVDAMLAALAAELGGGTGFTVSLRVSPAAGAALGPGAAEHVVHLAREALTNAARHGGADRALVRLGVRRGCVVLTVRDEGRGFDRHRAGSGMGLDNMRRRAALLGGQVSIASAPGAGTTVRLEIPVGSANPVGPLHVSSGAQPPISTSPT